VRVCKLICDEFYWAKFSALRESYLKLIISAMRA
jgi:hypothetical protein